MGRVIKKPFLKSGYKLSWVNLLWGATLCVAQFALFPRAAQADAISDFLGIHLNNEISVGSWGNSSPEVGSWLTNNYSLNGIVGVRAGEWVIGGYAEFRTGFEFKTEVPSTTLADARHSIDLLGAGASLKISKVLIFGAIGFLGKTSLTNPKAYLPSTDQTVDFGSPFAVHLALGIQLVENLYLTATYFHASFKNQTLTSLSTGKAVETVTTLSNPLEINAFGVGIAVRY